MFGKFINSGHCLISIVNLKNILVLASTFLLKNECMSEVFSEAVKRRCSVEKLLRKILQSSGRNTYAGVSFIIIL